MNLYNTTIEDVVARDVDILFAGCGYEHRAIALSDRLREISIRKKVAFAFGTRHILHWKSNYEWYQANDFSVIEIHDDEAENLFATANFILDQAAINSGEDSLTILIDYSSITRSWLAALLRAVESRSVFIKHVYFSYSMALYAAPPAGEFINESVEPIPGFWELSEPGRPVSLVIGLGYEESRALGAKEMLDPARTLVLYTDPVSDVRFLQAIMESNKILLQQIADRDKFTYDVEDLGYLNRLLGDVCTGLSGADSAVVIVPLGPKPFCLVSLVVSRRISGVDVWRITGGDFEAPIDRVASGKFLVAGINLG